MRALLRATRAWKGRFCRKIGCGTTDDEKAGIILTDLRKDRIQREIDDSVAWRMSPKRKCLIVFTGRDMKPFERRDQLHRRLMANGFLYLRYDFGRDMREVKRKGESSACRGVLADFIKSACNIHFFAFSRNDDFKEQFGKKYKSEQVNFRTVTEEIAALASYSSCRCKTRCAPGRHTPARICFYILSEDDVDHPTYSVRFDDWGKKLGENNKFLAGVILDYKIINEAERATWKLALGSDDQGHTDNNILTDESGGNWIKEYVVAAGKVSLSPIETGACADDHIVKRRAPIKRILSLGFGDTARKTIGGLYVNNDGNMIVDVIDSRASSIMGGYMRSHPSVLCMPAKSTDAFKNNHATMPDVAKNDPVKWWMYWYNNLLAVNYAELDGTGDKAAEYIDDSFGNRDPGRTENYDAFIIALGDDELSLDCFRNVMSDIRRELIDPAADPKKKLTIFVHLREKGNAERLYWAAEREIEDIKDQVDVRAYGAREDDYTYDELANDAEAIEMNN